MPANTSRRAKKKNSAQTRADRELLEDLEGGFNPLPPALRDLTYFLRCNHRLTEADDLERAIYRTHSPDSHLVPFEEQKVNLKGILIKLAYLRNNLCTGDLAPEKQAEWRRLLREAINRALRARRPIQDSLKREQRAIQNLSAKLQIEVNTPRTPLPNSNSENPAPPTDEPQPDSSHHAPTVTLSGTFVGSFSGRVQRLLLETLNGKERVLIDDVLRAVYGSSDRSRLDALLQAVIRANRILAESEHRCQLSKEGETLRLAHL
jgi:hypothetical protein